ncbi:sulfatase-like hydrolase/transferase [Candidatus Woesearchaeota archaeon]|nr:sulfatase-like hydrolase/transferase [Candidatus Woesearchaeota archaeon]
MKELISYDHNVLLVTLDSCRYDTFNGAVTPTMNRLGLVKPALTHGDYTLPAHVSIFNGQLPRVRGDLDLPPDDPQGVQLWRLSRARSVEGIVGLLLDGYTLQDGYRNRGFAVRGFGGTAYFWEDTDILRLPYKVGEFTHFAAREVGDKHGWEYPRLERTFPFFHVDEIAESVHDQENWFLFINAPETHWPYHSGVLENQELVELVKYSHQFRGGRTDPKNKFSYETGGHLLHELQRKALEYIDRRLEILLDKLPSDKPIVVVICGDHGEAFGEGGLWGHILSAPQVLNVPLIKNLSYRHQK